MKPVNESQETYGHAYPYWSLRDHFLNGFLFSDRPISQGGKSRVGQRILRLQGALQAQHVAQNAAHNVAWRLARKLAYHVAQHWHIRGVTFGTKAVVTCGKTRGLTFSTTCGIMCRITLSTLHGLICGTTHTIMCGITCQNHLLNSLNRYDTYFIFVTWIKKIYNVGQ